MRKLMTPCRSIGANSVRGVFRHDSEERRFRLPFQLGTITDQPEVK